MSGRHLSLLSSALGLCLAASINPLSAQTPREERPTNVIRFRTESALDSLEKFALKAMDEEKVPGMSMAVIQKDQLIYAKGFGFRKQGDSSAKVDEHTLFEIGSTSKAFTATLLAMLVDGGKIDWNDPVTQYIPEFRLKDPFASKEFQVVDTVCQRSGMGAYSIDFMSFLGFNRNEIIHALRELEPVSSFRSTFAYVNHMWLVAAKILETKTGLSWENNLDLMILGPLGMKSSSTDPEWIDLQSNVASGHMALGDGRLAILPKDWPFRTWLTTYGPAGSIVSNIVDMSHWVRFHLGDGSFEGKSLLKTSSLAKLHAPRTLAAISSDHHPMAYASGWIHEGKAGPVLIWHNGGTSGQHSIVGLVPDAQVGLVVLTNSNDNKVPERILAEFYNLFVASANKLSPRDLLQTAELLDRPLSKSSHRAIQNPCLRGGALPLDRYCGTYRNPAYGLLTITQEGQSLKGKLGPAQRPVSLTHFSGNVFNFKLVDYPADLGASAVFSIPSGQNAESVTVDLLSDVQNGLFRRE